jgi:hypothetical protein
MKLRKPGTTRVKMNYDARMRQEAMMEHNRLRAKAKEDVYNVEREIQALLPVVFQHASKNREHVFVLNQRL